MSALRKIEAKLGTATRNNHLHLLTYLQPPSFLTSLLISVLSTKNTQSVENPH